MGGFWGKTGLTFGDSLSDEESAAAVDGHDAVKEVGGGVDDGGLSCDPGVVDEAVEGKMRLNRRLRRLNSEARR